MVNKLFGNSESARGRVDSVLAEMSVGMGEQLRHAVHAVQSVMYSQYPEQARAIDAPVNHVSHIATKAVAYGNQAPAPKVETPAATAVEAAPVNEQASTAVRDFLQEDVPTTPPPYLNVIAEKQPDDPVEAARLATRAVYDEVALNQRG
ncbi:MAG TPA: hypothetical protein VFH39_01705 [Candidatus Saccharimonadales bacterium]|nr:hypothetical protein [Candidatus Saccharimonadales bacterium]